MMSRTHSNSFRLTQGLRALCAAFIVSIAISGCGGGSPPPSEGQATVDAAGATVVGPDGVSLAIAPLAVASSTTFRIARNSTGAPPLIGMTLASPIYEVTPHGAAFDPAALLTLPYNPSMLPTGTTPVVLRGEPDGSWHVQPLRNGSPTTALVDVNSLSWYAIGACTPGDAGIFGFGIGDCPANSEFKLEYLDGSGTAVPVPRAFVGGYALPFATPITVATDVTLRVTWSRPAGVNRVDTVRLYGASSFENFQQDTNQQIFTRDVIVHIDPTQVTGASSPTGVVKHYSANAFYCFQGFVIGLGQQTVCWNFDTDLAFRIHDTSTPGAPVITTQPLNRDVTQAEPGAFTVKARAAQKLAVNWQRFNPANSTWVAADNTTVFPSGGTQTGLYPGGGQEGYSTFTIASTALGDDKAMFRAQVCDVQPSASQSCVFSNEVTLGVVAVNAVTGFPVFTQQPQSASVLERQSYSLTVTATSSPSPDIVISQVGVGTVWTCPNPGLGAVSNTCTYPTRQLALSDSGMQFVATASNGPRFTSTSQTATVTVTTGALAPSIPSSDPADVVVAAGDPATFTVNASGTAPLNYQWSCDAGPISGANGSSLTLTAGQPAYFDGAQCYVVVTNSASPNGVQSRSATLTVAAAPLAITRQPVSVGVVAPATAMFSVVVNNPSSANYQWQLSTDSGTTWTAIGSSSPSYTTPATSIADNNSQFRVVVSDGNTTLTSSAATLTVVSGQTSATGGCFTDAAGWCYEQPAPDANTLTALVFDPGTRTATAVGYAGTVMQSTDSGSSWTLNWDASRFWWFDMVQPLSGTLVGIGQPWLPTGPNGTKQFGTRGLYRSTDGGASWAAVSPTNGVAFTPTLAFADANVGVVSQFGGGASDFLRTTDGGATWNPVHLPSALATAGANLSRIAYAGNNSFVGVGAAGTVLRSSDAGLTWSLVSSGTSNNLFDVAFGGTGFGVAIDYDHSQVLRTTDFGATWSVAPTAIQNATAVAFADANTVVVFGQFGAVSRATDGGSSWSTPDTSLSSSGQQNWHPRFADSVFGLAVGDYGAVARTLDGGQTWTRIAGGTLGDSITQLEASPGGAAILANTLNSVLRSTDGGLSWSSSNQPMNSGTASWSSSSTAMLFDLFGTISRSDDAGATWSTLLNDATVNFRAGAMASSATAVVAGAQSTNQSPSAGGGFLRRTTDGGATWTNVTLPSDQWMYTARFLTPLVGLIGGENATLMRTTDGGATWSLVNFNPQTAGGSNTVTNIARVSDTVAILSTASEIKRSTDGGLTWTQVYYDFPFNGVGGGIAFSSDALHGVAVGVVGLVLTTSDGGQTWTSQNLPIDFNLAAVTWANATTPLIGGDGGALLRNSRSGALSMGQPSFVQARAARAIRSVPTPAAPTSRSGSKRLAAQRQATAGSAPKAVVVVPATVTVGANGKTIQRQVMAGADGSVTLAKP